MSILLSIYIDCLLVFFSKKKSSHIFFWCIVSKSNQFFFISFHFFPFSWRIGQCPNIADISFFFVVYLVNALARENEKN